MSRTPEAKLKDAVRSLLTAHNAYYSMPVQTGYGDCLLDFHPVVLNGHAFFIETKAPNGRLTARQANTIEQIRNAGGVAFVVKTAQDFDNLRLYIARIHAQERVNG